MTRQRSSGNPPITLSDRYRWPYGESLFAATYTELHDGWRVRITRPPTDIFAVFTADKLDDLVLHVLVDQEKRAQTLARTVVLLHGFTDGGPEAFAVMAAERGWCDLLPCRSTSPVMTYAAPLG